MMRSSEAEYDFVSCSLEKGVKITDKEGVPPKTILEVFEASVSNHSQRPALTYQLECGTWKTLNYSQYFETTQRVARAFIKLGLGPRKSVCVLSVNCPEWMFAEFGAFYSNAVICGIYPTSSADACVYVLQKSQCNICIVDNTEQLQKINSIKDQVPSIKAIIQIHEPFGDLINENDDYFTWTEIMSMDARVYENQLIKRVKDSLPEQLVILKG
ncbi:ACSBG1.2 family protein [Megaselia abdita]